MEVVDIETFGDYYNQDTDSQEYLIINFSPSSIPRNSRWRNNGISADFLGDYFATFFPGDEIPDSKIGKQETVKSSVSFIANELLENAMKYSLVNTNLPVSIALYMYNEKIVFMVTNHISLESSENYQTYIKELLSSDMDEMFTKQLMKASSEGNSSGIGLLTIINDYGAKPGWKFQKLLNPTDVVKLTITIQLEV